MTRRCSENIFGLVGFLTFALVSTTLADGPVVDRVYDPYVQPLEREIEARGVIQNDRNATLDELQVYQFGVGRSWSDQWWTEVYLIGKKFPGESFGLEAFELEAKWQITEQGEYWADWGLLFEVEREREVDINEISTRLLVAREWGRWITNANLGVQYEWGEDIRKEWETSFSVQGRYRMSRAFEPALELYMGQNHVGIGPVMIGEIRSGIGKKWRWEFGVIIGVDENSPDQTWRGLIEYEF